MEFLENKNWPEMFLVVYKRCEDNLKRMEKFINDFESEFVYGTGVYELEEYVDTYNNQVHVPNWNRASVVTPDQCKLAVEGVIFTCCYDVTMIFKGWWDRHDKTFKATTDFSKEPLTWTVEEVGYWIPLTYPTPY